MREFAFLYMAVVPSPLIYFDSSLRKMKLLFLTTTTSSSVVYCGSTRFFVHSSKLH